MISLITPYYLSIAGLSISKLPNNLFFCTKYAQILVPPIT